jgi:hypothetical protein
MVAAPSSMKSWLTHSIGGANQAIDLGKVRDVDFMAELPCVSMLEGAIKHGLISDDDGSAADARGGSAHSPSPNVCFDLGQSDKDGVVYCRTPKCADGDDACVLGESCL